MICVWFRHFVTDNKKIRTKKSTSKISRIIEWMLQFEENCLAFALKCFEGRIQTNSNKISSRKCSLLCTSLDTLTRYFCWKWSKKKTEIYKKIELKQNSKWQQCIFYCSISVEIEFSTWNIASGFWLNIKRICQMQIPARNSLEWILLKTETHINQASRKL